MPITSAAMHEGWRDTWGTAWWMMAGLVGLTGAVTLAVAGPFGAEPRAKVALVAVACGWLLMLACAPWRREMAIRARRSQLARLAAEIRACRAGEPRDLGAALPEARGEVAELRDAVQVLVDRVGEDRATAERLRRRMGESIERETHKQTLRLRREALTDPLTGLANRRALRDRLAALAEQYPGPASVVAMAIDVDRFKQVNDTLGHQTGDACLRFLGELLRSSVRRGDCAVRLGGDEFVVIMPGHSVDGARTMAERLTALFQQMPWPHHGVPRPTVSIGLATMGHQELGDGDGLLRQADAALYRAKKSGRARIEMGA